MGKGQEEKMNHQEHWKKINNYFIKETVKQTKQPCLLVCCVNMWTMKFFIFYFQDIRVVGLNEEAGVQLRRMAVAAERQQRKTVFLSGRLNFPILVSTHTDSLLIYLRNTDQKKQPAAIHLASFQSTLTSDFELNKWKKSMHEEFMLSIQFEKQ